MNYLSINSIGRPWIDYINIQLNLTNIIRWKMIQNRFWFFPENSSTITWIWMTNNLNKVRQESQKWLLYKVKSLNERRRYENEVETLPTPKLYIKINWRLRIKRKTKVERIRNRLSELVNLRFFSLSLTLTFLFLVCQLLLL